MSSLDFVAVDVETANADLASICQLGVATVRAGQVEDVWTQLVDPEDLFSPINVRIHGINEAKVRGAPRFAELFPEIENRLAGVVVSHTAFDRLSLGRACERCGLQLCERAWLDSARVARRTWPDKYARHYGLGYIASDLGIVFKHHNAGEDARTAAEIILRACTTTSLSVGDLLQQLANHARRPSSSEPIRLEGNADGALFGEVLVFTGALAIPRRDAADLAAKAGCRIDTDVTKTTTLLVVGDQDVRRLAGHEKSAKFRKAETLIESGQPIRIVRESDFRQLVLQPLSSGLSLA
jgi:DNA polymerase-3 subunit epsilon